MSEPAAQPTSPPPRCPHELPDPAAHTAWSSENEDEARFVTRLAADLIVAHLTVFQQTKIGGPNVVRMIHMLPVDARRAVAAPAQQEAA